MKRIAAFFGTIVLCGQSLAFSASDCSDAAGRLKRAARDLEDAASRSDATRQGLQNELSEVASRVRRLASECGSTTAAPGLALMNIHAYLKARYGDGQRTMARLREVDGALRRLAAIHEQIGSADYNATYSVAAEVFEGTR